MNEGTITIGSTTITPLRQEAVPKYAVVDEEGDVEDRDEADGADEDVNFNSSDVRILSFIYLLILYLI